MKKFIALLLTVGMLALSLLAAGCSGGKGNDGETAKDSGTAAPVESNQSDTTGVPVESSKETSSETEETPGSETEGEPHVPSFDTSGPWDGVNASVKWYIDADPREGYKLYTAYDFFGFSLMVNRSGLKENIFYDEDGMVIFDTDGDGDLSDEAGYSEQNVIIGDVFQGMEILLMNDVDLNGKDWWPVGSNVSLRGYFDGQDHTVKNFYVSTESALHHGLKTSYYYGLFGALAYGAEVKNLTIENETLKVELADDAKNVQAGGVASLLNSDAGGGGVISNVTVNGLTIIVSGNDVCASTPSIGAIVGVHANTNVQSNITVNDYQLIDNYTDETHSILTQPDNYQARDGKSELFLNCQVNMKAS